MLEVAIALFTAALGGAAGYLYSEKRAQKLIDRARIEAEEEYQAYLEQEREKWKRLYDQKLKEELEKLKEELEREITKRKEEELKELYAKLEREKTELERLKLQLELKGKS